ncbi:MAG TPA: DUF1295 domain-containing protein, partial [Gammaproteobacteria bacterium]|nr:DUF1295 domain-containing protein [Gammaproteobacteria bacterium]
MLNLAAYLGSGLALVGVALLAWLVSLVKRDVSIVDSLWSLMFLGILVIYAAITGANGPRAILLTGLVAVWALRLSAHIAWRNRGQPEDHRYREIRRNNEPGFALKSLYIVFGLQALLAWIIAVPLAVGTGGDEPLGVIDLIGLLLWIGGFGIESIGDWQLARFKRQPANRGRVLDTGLWAYTRHPNYFGECVLWWGYYAIALSAGGWWTAFAPLLMTFLLLRVSGVALLERD